MSLSTSVMSRWQGSLRAEAPLLLEIFAALFEGIAAKALLDASAEAVLGKQVPAQPAAVARAPGLQPGAPTQHRHPRFGGIFVARLEGGKARCAVGCAQQADLLGPVAPIGKLPATVRGWAVSSMLNC